MVDQFITDAITIGLVTPLFGLVAVTSGMFGAKLLNIARGALYEGVKETKVATA